jgi:hypothetical protein
MATQGAAIRERNRLPVGTVVVGAGLAVTGVASYGFLVTSARVLPPPSSAASRCCGFLVSTVGGMFLPFERELSRRLVGRRVAGLRGRSIVRRALALARRAGGRVDHGDRCRRRGALSPLRDHR